MSIVLCIVSKENQLISISRSKITQNIRNMQENYDFCNIFYDFSCTYGVFIAPLRTIWAEDLFDLKELLGEKDDDDDDDD